MNKPLVSVIIITYNHESFIHKAIEGCLMQKTSFPFEIIIHDDASPDKTAEIVQEYYKNNPRIILPILQKENQLSKGVRISASIIPFAKGKYVAFCEGDDYWIDPLKLEKQIAIMESNPDVSMCYTAIKKEYLHKKKQPTIKRHYHGDRIVAPKDVVLKGGGFSDIVTTVVRKSIYDDIPEWFYKAPIGDVALTLLAMIRGDIYYLDEVTAVYNAGVPLSWSMRMTKDSSRMKQHTIRMIRFRDQFDQATDLVYHKFINKRNNYLIIDSLLESGDERKELMNEYYSRLNLLEKLEFHFFDAIGSHWFRKKFTQIRKIFRKY